MGVFQGESPGTDASGEALRGFINDAEQEYFRGESPGTDASGEALRGFINNAEQEIFCEGCRALRTEIIYEDKELLVVRKPAGLATQTARVSQADVVSELKNYVKSPWLGVVHRLDQPVEGLLVFARTKGAAAALSKQLAEGALHKQYYAVICGTPIREQGELVDYLYKDTQREGRAVVVEEQDRFRFPDAKKAVLQYRLLQYKAESDLSLMEIHIDTGRFHQIRAQMAHAGMALLGDAKYADDAVREKGKELGVSNVALCAYHIEFRHPVRKQKMCFRIHPEGSVFAIFGQCGSSDPDKTEAR